MGDGIWVTKQYGFETINTLHHYIPSCGHKYGSMFTAYLNVQINNLYVWDTLPFEN